MIGVYLRRLAIFCHCIMWAITGLACAADPLPRTGNEVHHDDIYVPLGVYLSSIAATAVFTWMVAQWDKKRTLETKALEIKVKQLLEEKTRNHSHQVPDDGDDGNTD